MYIVVIMQLLSEDSSNTCRRNQSGCASCVLYIVSYMGPLTVQPLTFELSEAPVATLFGSKVKCVVKLISRVGGAKVTNQITS